MKKKEQSSKVLAEDSLPKHVIQCNDLINTNENLAPNTFCFYSHDGSVFIGIVFKETEDSFLVGAPVVLSMNQSRQVSTSPVSAEAVIRLLKGGIKYVVKPTELTLHYFYKYLVDFGKNILPDYLNEDRLEFISNVVRGTETGAFISNSSLAEVKQEIPGAHKNSVMSFQVSEGIH